MCFRVRRFQFTYGNIFHSNNPPEKATERWRPEKKKNKKNDAKLLFYYNNLFMRSVIRPMMNSYHLSDGFICIEIAVT